MTPIINKEDFEERLRQELQNEANVTPIDASDNQIYKALSAVVVGLLREKRRKFSNQVHSAGKKEIYYLSMEFLMGRSLKTSLYNLEINDMVTDILKKWDVNIDRIYDYEPDAGLGNGGLGRLAACYLDGLATDGYPAMGYSICYEYGIFKQKIEDGWQTELPDNWLPGGESWLVPKTDKSIEVHFDGELQEYWDQQYHHVSYKNYSTDVAVITILNVPDEPGTSFKIFGLLAQKNINVDIILQSTGRDGKKDISFTCAESEAETALRVLRESAKFDQVTCDETCAKVSIVGAGMQSHSGVASKMFEALSNNNINIKMISTSEIKISCIIDREDADKAVSAIHEMLFE